MDSTVEAGRGAGTDARVGSIRLVCLDFDGTVMVYDEPPRFHPEVIELLNALGACGVQWCTNSGRDLADQTGVLKTCREHGLVHEPVGLLCAESLAYAREDNAYRALEPWNTAAHRDLLRLHARAQKKLRPHVARIEERYGATTYAGEHFTAFNVGEEGDKPLRLFLELQALLDDVPNLMLTRNGPWVAVLMDRLGKGNVLLEFGRTQGFAPDQILAVGDQFNDLNMLDGVAARHVGCPANSIAEVIDAVRKQEGHVGARGGPEGTIDVIRHYLGHLLKG